MIIYFLNKKSIIKGPFDIMDAHRNRIMKVGDICVREDKCGVSCLLIIDENNRWNTCKRIGYAKGNLGIEGNTLLFSFDGVSKRFGRIKECETICKLFAYEPLHSFFTNAVEILTYKCDQWDIATFSNILTLSPIEIPIKVKKEEHAQYNTCITLFEAYLSNESHHLFVELHSVGNSLRKIYQEIRQKYPDDFRHAMKKFLAENPTKTIYDKQ